MGTAVVTGASSGLGRELAQLLASRGEHVVVVARSPEALTALAAASSRIQPVVADLSTPQGRDELGKVVDVVDILVNNAGFGSGGRFADAPRALSDQMVDVNVAALTDLTARWLPGMVARGAGRIVNVASTAAFQPGPNMAVYYATKAYVLSFSEALANELSGTGVTVTALCPGPTITDFQKTAGVEKTALFTGPLVMDAAAVARAGYRGMLRGQRLVIPGVANNVLVQALRVSPRRLATAIIRRIQESR
jgi:uncharacterized protein